MIELLIVDDHNIFRAGIARLMSDEPDIRVVGEAADGPTAISMLRQRGYGVVLMDINMGARSGLDTLAQLRCEWPRLPVIMLSMYVEAQYARQALRHGANAYLSKDVSQDELVRAIRYVAQGRVYATPELLQTKPVAAAGAPHAALSPRELQVLIKIARGVPLTAIGVQMCISVKTISSHRSHILEKLDMRSNAELVQYAMRHGLVD